MGDLFTIALVIFFCLIGFAVLTAYFLRSRKVKFVHETGTSILFGAIVGLIIRLSSSSEELRSFVEFNSEVFMLVLLPQIIFESGYNMRRKAFFKNASSFLLLAFVGTLISMFIISFGLILFVKIKWIGVALTPRDCLIFGSLISATDPVSVLAIFTQLKVHRDLFMKVFGESVMNDAIAIVLVQTFLKFHKSSELTAGFVFQSIGLFLGVFLGSVAIGSFFGFLTSLLFKHTQIKDFPLLESTVTFLIAWMSFFLAEAIGLSGIASILFCGIIDAHYTFNNLSEHSQKLTKEWIHLTAYVSESFIFIYLGFAAFSFTHLFKWKLILFSLLLCLLSRFFNVYPLVWINNIFKESKNRIMSKEKFVLWFAGLRGAIAFALSLILTDEHGRILMTTTLTIVFFTVFILGGFTNPLLKKFDLAFKDKDEPLYKQKKKTRFLEFDRKYLKPLFTHKKYGEEELISLKRKKQDEQEVKKNNYKEFVDHDWKVDIGKENILQAKLLSDHEETELEDI
ncbi:sodium/hydrogen exchanger [Anaeramoeba flamelloides]|uniref:Sodium/hydrogen exchanger n=1 Tax=Anaeramoeba flamelloides TaxID=1746091 RepID=A0AAV8ADC7_9EUKA|nr:sodium/hydrogen exchanger [Anaeramoeba flamelloides]